MFDGILREEDLLLTRRSAEAVRCRACHCFEGLSPYTLEFLERALALRSRQPYRDFREIIRECCFDPHNQVRPLEEFDVPPNTSVLDITWVLRLLGQRVS